MSSASPLTNRPTGVTNGGSRRASSVARSTVTWRGLFAKNTRPMASAPAAIAASTSAGRDKPQILMRVRALPSWKPVGGATAVGNAMGRIVVRAREIEAVRAERRRGPTAVARRQHLVQPVGVAPPTADEEEAAHDVADHVMKERVGVELEAPIGTPPTDRQRAQRSHRRGRLALRGTKSAEVVLTQQARSGALHCRRVEPTKGPADAARFEARPDRRLVEHIDIASPE